MIDKRVRNLAAAVEGIADGATIMVGGFGAVGQPDNLIDALIDQGARDLTIVANNAGTGRVGLARLLELRRARKIICSFPRSAGSVVFEKLFRAGELELEIVPQGTLAERIRAAGAGVRLWGGRRAVEAWRADRWGNCVYRESGRNFNAIMATAAGLTVVQTQYICELGEIDPEAVVTPGIFVDRVVHVPTSSQRPERRRHE